MSTKLLPRLISAVALVAAIACVSPAQAASSTLRFTGKIAGLDAAAGNAVMLLAHDGTSVRAAVATNGKFALVVPNRIVRTFVPNKRGRGATLHVLVNGEYEGPVLLRKANAKKGYMRLSSTLRGSVSLGNMSMQGSYAAGNVKAKFVDTSTSIKLKKSAPVSTFDTSANVLPSMVRPMAALTDEVATLGADADRDGLPNVADADMNGDGFPDAAQPDSTGDFVGLKDAQVLESRPTSRINLSKILYLETATQTNSNANPSVTPEQIRESLARGLSIEIGLPIEDTAEFAKTSVVMDCRKLSYCEPGSTSMVRAAPGDPNDGKPLSALQDTDGLIAVPQRAGENTYLLRFFPGAASAAAGNLAGDVYELITKVDGQTTTSEAKVVTSSVATPMALISLDGKNVPTGRDAAPVAVSSLSALQLSFYRPQSFAGDGAETLLDRGGLTYFVSIWPDDKSNTGYFCKAQHMDNLSATLLKSPSSLPPVEQGVFDSELAPTANGTKLSLALDAQKCLTDQANAKHTFVSGQAWRLELEAQDSDGNKVRVDTRFRVP